MKEIHIIAKYNKRGDVVMQCHHAIEHEWEKCESSVFRKERLVYPRLITLLR